jgi:hypothetical protein
MAAISFTLLIVNDLGRNIFNRWNKMSEKINLLFDHEKEALLDALRRDRLQEHSKILTDPKFTHVHEMNVRLVTRILEALDADDVQQAFLAASRSRYRSASRPTSGTLVDEMLKQKKIRPWIYLSNPE